MLHIEEKDLAEYVKRSLKDVALWGMGALIAPPIAIVAFGYAIYMVMGG